MSTVFSVTASWQGGLGGRGELIAPGFTMAHSAPAALGGAGAGTNPEELLVAAAASCYLITLGAVLARRELPLHHVELTSTVSVSAAFEVEAIVHTPRIFVRKADDRIVAALKDCATRAEAMCLVARAVRGNVQVNVVAEVIELPDLA